MVIPRGTYTYTYQADGDKKLESITAPDGGQISYTYDGSSDHRSNLEWCNIRRSYHKHITTISNWKARA